MPFISAIYPPKGKLDLGQCFYDSVRNGAVTYYTMNLAYHFLLSSIASNGKAKQPSLEISDFTLSLNRSNILCSTLYVTNAHLMEY